MVTEEFEHFDEGDIVREYVGGGKLKLYKIVKWISNDVIFLVDVRKLEKVNMDGLSEDDLDQIVIDIDMLYENYTKKGIPEAALLLYGDRSEG